MKEVAVVYSNHTPLVDAVKSCLEGYSADFLSALPDNAGDYSLIVVLNVFFPKENIPANVLVCHYSLLPAFSGEEPVKEAFLAGVKVTGITIYFPHDKKIIAQYPLFIRQEAHFDEIEKELGYLEQSIFPIVIEKFVKNEPLDMKMFLKSGQGCAGNCGGCGGCKS